MVSMKSYVVDRVQTGGQGLGRGILESEVLEDRIKIKFHLQRPMGLPDEDIFIEVPFDDVDGLPEVRGLEQHGVGGVYTLEKRFVRLDLPDGRKLVFIYENSRETYSGAWSEEEVYGPFIER